MVNQPHAFKHRDVVRAVKAAKAAGIDASQVKVDPNTGEITVGPAPGGDTTGTTTDDRRQPVQTARVHGDAK